MLLLDANIYLRYILNDNTSQAKKSQDFIKNNEFYTDPTIIAEVIWVFTSYYRAKKESFVPALLAIVEQKNNKSSSKKIIIQALEYYYTHDFSYIDSYLYCLANTKNLSRATFDKKLSKTI
ncbi:MAG: hypothetical protein DPW11_00460 [bacterium]|nr:type II toxin-antitoxin system VapC family toxin [Candidatus Microgenomates bacterium CPR3]MCQ3944240.1 hypothetical protein [bacterium]RIK52068.1 MAG: hypothetical protein DCC61_00665 [Candidatus Microgenomates bacterium]